MLTDLYNCLNSDSSRILQDSNSSDETYDLNSLDFLLGNDTDIDLWNR